MLFKMQERESFKVIFIEIEFTFSKTHSKFLTDVITTIIKQFLRPYPQNAMQQTPPLICPLFKGSNLIIKMIRQNCKHKNPEV